ncbi:GNAT family N-acetyltransferase [Acuticoccus kandeliae]|uniref:GNAT family N-acetyltransferase n=1 Tax=Acuticoccus kandeliae TaxID=2073160 RepID=UPI000D3E1D55|nr:GNAT family N-acetyltransferase [Acuticoccus kandeliae]
MTSTDTIEIRPFTPADMEALGGLLDSLRAAEGCWCVWYIGSIRAYREGKRNGDNRETFSAIAAASRDPMGLVAMVDGAAVGWCATGPRARYARALNTPTYGRRDPAEDDTVWLIPCLVVGRDHRKRGLAQRLVAAATALAEAHGARAVEAFPFADGKRQSAENQVGFERMFTRAGFHVTNRPSPARAFMRRDFATAPGA